MRHVSLIAGAALTASSAWADLGAQVLDACPEMETDEAALIGYVQDPELGGVPVLGAVVTATWEIDGEPGSADTVVPDDGVYLICGVPRATQLTLQATFSGREGPVVILTVAEEAVRQDLTVSLSGQTPSEDAPLFIGPDSSGRCPDLRAPRLIQCILLDDCRFTRLGLVRARRVGGGRDMRETVETFVRLARQMGVDAVRAVRTEWRADAGRNVLVLIEGTGIEFTEERCKRWVTDPL